MKNFWAMIFMVFSSLAAQAKAVKPLVMDIDSLGLGCDQLLVVITPDWNSLEGNLYAFERSGGRWKLKFKNAVVVGSKGMAIGDGIIKLFFDEAPLKKEGDKRSPAGIFTIGTAFGYAEKATWIRNHYIQADDTLICVDDPRSIHYNRLIKNDSISKDWNSYEQMHRKDDYYKWGLFVNHNSGKTIAGDGSCIFLHIWENDHEGTEGCTAMREDDILKILHWIDEKRHPMLLQLPLEEYKRISSGYRLPSLQAK